MPERLSAIVLAKDEEDRLPATLATLAFADEVVVVVDAGSRDGTARVAEAGGARVHVRALDGAGARASFTAAPCQGPWILSVEAGERVSPELAREIHEILARGGAAGPSAYRIPLRLEFLGRVLVHDRDSLASPIRLYRQDGPRFDGEREHERPPVHGTAGPLSSGLVRSYRDLTHYLGTVDQTTTLAAAATEEPTPRAPGGAGGGAPPPNAVAQRTSDSPSRLRARRFLPLRFLWELVGRVVLRGAYRDGREGLAHAALSACSTLIRDLKVGERAGGGIDHPTGSSPREPEASGGARRASQ